MSVLNASNLRKEFSGDPLFDGVSFSVGRRDRLSLAGPNGAGKTTLLRAIAGEIPLQGGELAFSKGTRIALHDQRPPRELDLTLREYAVSGARDLLALEAELTRLEQEMAAGAHDEATLRRYADAQSKLEHGGGWAWRERAARDRARAGLPRRGSRPAALHVLRRRADARLARAGALRGARPAASRRADEPPRRREPRVARERARDAARGGHPRRARPLVPRGGHDGGARARARRRALLRRPVARVATREGGARAGGREDRRPRVRGHRAARAVRGTVPVQEVEGEAGAGKAHADRAPGEGAVGRARRARVAHATASHARVRLPLAAAHAAGSWSRPTTSSSRPATSCCSWTPSWSSSAERRSRSWGRTARARPR